jgi:hypothetical protein
MRLSVGSFERARDYLMRRGRPLEQALFRFFFEHTPRENALQALAAHQAADGGFFAMGEGSLTEPSPIGTTLAFQHLVDMGVEADSPLVERGIAYFIAIFDPNIDGRDWALPGAEVVGYLWKYRRLVREEFLHRATGLAMEHLRLCPVPIPAFSALCFLRLARFVGAPHDASILEKVAQGVRLNLELDHAKWETNYFVKPYWYALSPTAPLFAQLKDEVNACLDYDIRTQEADGSFHLTFRVTGVVETIWKSIWTLECLRVLRAYDRIEGMAP